MTTRTILLTLASLTGLALAHTTTPKAAELHSHDGASAHTHDEPATPKAAESHTHDGEPCTGHDEPAAEPHSHEGVPCTGDHGEGPTLLAITQKAQDSLALVYATAQKRPITSVTTIMGELLVPPASIRNYATPMKGEIELLTKAGLQVEAGAHLFKVKSPDLLQMLGEVQTAQAELERCRTESNILQKRKTTLDQVGTRNIEVETSLATKQAEEQLLINTLKRVQSQLALLTSGHLMREDGSLIIRAKAAGIVGDININQGAWLDQGSSVLNITPARAFEFRGQSFSGNNLQDHVGLLILKTGDQFVSLPGKLRMETTPDATTKTRHIYFTPTADWPATTFAGQTARLELTAPDAHAANFIPVPQGAVVRVGVEDVVFIKDPDKAEQFFMKKVTTRPSYQGLVPVAGLAEGDRIVVEGGNELKYAIPNNNATKLKSAGHFHADGKFHEGSHE